MLHHEFKANPQSFLLLFASLLVSLGLYLYFIHDPHVERFVVLFLCGIYFLWSLYHHYHRGDLSASIILEYLLMALLAVVFLMSTTI